MQQPTHIVGIALGSNLDNPQGQIEKAVLFLTHLAFQKKIRVARPILTEPEDCPPGSPLFVNTVAEMEWAGTPEELLTHLQNYEHESGRPLKRSKNAPRPIDLDIIYFDNLEIETPQLIIPHPRAHLRSFVIEPLREIAPHRVEWLLAKAQKKGY